MTRSFAATTVVFLLIAAVAACGDRDEKTIDLGQIRNADDTAATADTDTAGTIPSMTDTARTDVIPEPAAGERAPLPSDPVIEVQMGKGVTANGTVPENARTGDFRPGDTIFVTVRLRGLEGQPVTVSWFGPGDLSAGSETGTVKPDGTISFTKADTSSWIPGHYRVTLSSGPRTLISEQFHLLGSDAAVMPRK